MCLQYKDTHVPIVYSKPCFALFFLELMIFLFLFFIVLEFHVLVIKSTSYFLSKLSSTTVNMKALSFNNKQRFSKDNEFIYKQMTAYDLESSKLC
jgi:hypothetical protein